MKQYFAKLLPIGTATIGQTTKSSFKLFLCSRDIKVGDKLNSASGLYTANVSKIEDGKIYVDMSNGSKGLLHGKDLEEEFENEENLSQWYRVIGEISPEATWVKEGDEFDKEEICKWENVINAPNGRVVPTFYTIKGPCGHFH